MNAFLNVLELWGTLVCGVAVVGLLVALVPTPLGIFAALLSSLPFAVRGSVLLISE